MLTHNPYPAFHSAIMVQAAKDPCVGHSGSRNIAERMIRANPASYGLTLDQMWPVPVAVAATPKAATPVVAKPKGNGTCDQIRAWVRDNPLATKKEALLHFSHLNPSTVGVQFGKARANGQAS